MTFDPDLASRLLGHAEHAHDVPMRRDLREAAAVVAADAEEWRRHERWCIAESAADEGKMFQ